MLYLRAQDELLAQMQRQLRDTGMSRWTATELTDALSRALDTWSGRVSVQATYELPNGWPNDQFEITLEDWLPDDMRPQAQWPVDPLLPNEVTLSTWKDITTWQVEAAEDGSLTLRLQMAPYNGQLRLLYPVRNGRLPATAVTLDGAITASATSLALDTELPEVGRAGWVRIGAEWIGYRGVALASGATTLENLVRGQHDTTAGSHSDGDAVQWGVAANNAALFAQLLDQACAFAHEYYLTDGSPRERDLHERMLSYFQQRSDLFWRRHVPGRAPRWKYGAQ